MKNEKIKLSLQGDQLNLFLHEENLLQRKIDLCKNRIAIYLTGLMFISGWIIFMVYKFVNIGFVDSSIMVSEVSNSIFSGEMIISTIISLFALAGFIRDIFLLAILKAEFAHFIKKWGRY